MVGTSALKARITRLEALVCPETQFARVFVSCVDASKSDPERTAEEQDYSDAGVIGVTFNSSRFSPSPGRISRRPGESIEDLQQRAGRTVPEVPLFMFAYRCKRPQFDELEEAAPEPGLMGGTVAVERENYVLDEPGPDNPIF